MSARATEHMSEPNSTEINAEETNGEAAGEAGVENDAVEQGDAGADDNGAGTAGPDEAAELVDPDMVAESRFEVEADLGELSVETLVADLERVAIERDQYLEVSRRIQAEFENYRKQVSKRELEARERANEALISEMLPVLDAFDGAVTSGVDEVVPMRTTLLDALGKQGLVRIDPADADAPFDPNQHEAVMHDDGESGQAGPIVAEVMRAGYSWRGRVIRPAMVRVRG